MGQHTAVLSNGRYNVPMAYRDGISQRVTPPMKTAVGRLGGGNSTHDKAKHAYDQQPNVYNLQSPCWLMISYMVT